MSRTLQDWNSDCDRLFHPKAAKYIKKMTSMLATARANMTEEDRKKVYSQFPQSNEVAQECCAARLIKIQNDVLAHTFALSFFELTVLEDGEWPQIINNHIDRNFKVTKLGQNGGAPKKQVVERMTNLQLLMERLTSEEYEFPLYNLQVGQTDQLDKAQARITYEMVLKLDALARAILDASRLASGLRATLNLHPSIVATNIPDKNYYDLSGVGTSGKWDVEKIKQVLDYTARFSADTSDDLGALEVKTIYVPSVSKRDWWDMCDLVSAYSGSGGAAPTGVVADPKNTIPHEARLEIWRSDKLSQMFGYEFSIVTRNVIAAPYNYVAMNRPVGMYFHKPSQDKIILDNSAAKQKDNTNSIMSAQTMQLALMSEYTKNYMVVKV